MSTHLLLLLLCLVASAVEIAPARADTQVNLQIDRLTAGKFGRNFGRGNHSKVIAKFNGNGQHLLLHARSFDIDSFDEVRIRVNGESIGQLPLTKNRALSGSHLWIIPAAIQKAGPNKITFVLTNNDRSWGVQDLGLYSVGSSAARFGNWPNNRGLKIVRRAVLHLPTDFDAAQLSFSFYDIDNPREAVIRPSSGGKTIPPNTRDNDWGRSFVVEVPANTESIDISNLAASTSGKIWGFQLDGFYYGFPENHAGGFRALTRAEWGTAEVRRVLHTFAFGGRASETQIQRWSKMDPRHAITEMLNFDEHNLKLSPPSKLDRDAVHRQPGTLRGMTKYWSGNRGSNPVPRSSRNLIGSDWSLGIGWSQMAMARGLNPFRQKIGLWETNYHMAVNMNTNVDANQVITYYDKIMEQLENNTPYSRVLSDAATSAAIATQYNHGDSKWISETQTCECNEDFAREYHQLFFGILGRDESHYHETVSIKNMAKALTDIRVLWNSRKNRFEPWPVWGSSDHHGGALEIQHASIGGVNARDKITTLSQISIEHPESQANLPIKIIGGLADDNLTEEKIAVIRNAWQSMRPKNLLGFLRAYAISDTFHSRDRVKYWTSIDRSMIFANKYYASNQEGYYDIWYANSYRRDQVDVFRPKHNVFGGQTGLEAARSPDIVRRVINDSTEHMYYFVRQHLETDGRKIQKNWTSIVPKSANGKYRVKDVAEWLWNQYIGDDLKHFNSVARAHVYALLGHQHDLLLILSERDINRVITERDLKHNPRIRRIVRSLAGQQLKLDSSKKALREEAHRRLGRAIAFIVATPFSFAQQGK